MGKGNRKGKKRRSKQSRTPKRNGQRQQTRPRPPPGPRPEAEKGYEFGVSLHVMAASIPLFVNALGEAKVVACAHGGQQYQDLGMLPSITLVAENPGKLEEGLVDLEKRAQPIGGDSIGIGILLQPSGGFRISISIDPVDLALRTLPGNYLHSPLAVAASWLYDLKSTHPQLANTTTWKEENPLFPVLLAGAALGPRGELVPVGPVVPVFNFRSATNTTGKPATLFASFGVVAQGHKRTDGPPRYTEVEVLQRRIKMLGRYFPITSGRTGAAALPTDDPKWATRQALCNLTLSREITGRAFYVGIPGGDLSVVIEEHLRSRDETHGILASAFTDEEIKRQIELDRASFDRYTTS